MVDQNRRWVDDPLAAGFMQGRYTTRYRIVDGDADYLIVGSKGPGQGPPEPVAGRPLLATLSPGTAEGGIYDPIDSFYVPIWGFGGLERLAPVEAFTRRQVSGCNVRLVVGARVLELECHRAVLLLVVHGDNDAVVPITLGERLYGLIQAPKRFVRVAGGGHNDLGARAVAAAKRFISEQ